MAAKQSKPLVLLAKCRVFYTSKTRGKHLAEAGDVVDPVDADLSHFLDLGLIDEQGEPAENEDP